MGYLVCFYSSVASFYERVRKGYEWKKLQGSFSQGRARLLPGLIPLGLGQSRKRKNRREKGNGFASAIPENLETVRPHAGSQQAPRPAYLDEGTSP